MRDLGTPLAPSYGDPKKKKAKKSIYKYHKGEPPINKMMRDSREHGRKLSKFLGGTGLTVAETKANAKENALLKAAKSKQRNPKPGPYQY
tara:strand:+ start:395 stop:664 length:270 start_codon:yes stop_codon:yes gene_type:complete